MKKSRKIMIAIIILFLLLSIFLWKNKKEQKDPFQDEFIFFHMFSSEKEKNKLQEKSSYPRYNLKVSHQDIAFKNLSLIDTIDKKTLVHEKIAPRNRGDI